MRQKYPSPVADQQQLERLGGTALELFTVPDRQLVILTALISQQ
jgi:hypothetical protein